ncbi:MAG TPA: 50S ribosomal protein L23 [Thermoplasmata archaeon]|nr:50S ribosomal protein L23 [Thermoplasmata archaeon]
MALGHHEILLHPYVTEKTLTLMERENKLEFVVKRDASKDQIKRAFEERYDVKVADVATKRVKDGKHAIIKFAEGYRAEDVGMRIGIF